MQQGDECVKVNKFETIFLKSYPQPAGFEPARGNPIGFQVQRLNHSATTAF